MLLASLLALSPAARAAGFYFTDTGTRGMARAGAFVAGADDLSAQYYNPAALTQLHGPQVYINHTVFHQSVRFTRVDLDETGAVTQTWPEVHNQAAPMQIPAFGVGHDFGLPNTYVAFGMWTPMAPSMSFPHDGSTSYTLKDSLTWQIWGGPSVAQRIGWLSVGLGVHWTLVRAEQSLNLMVCTDENFFNLTIEGCPSDADPATSDFQASMAMIDPFRLTGNLGLLATPTQWLKVGFSVLPPLKVRGKGSLSVDIVEDHWLLTGDGEGNLGLIASSHAEDEEVSVRLRMPWILRGGVAVRPHPRIEVEGAAVWQRWSSSKRIRITDVNLVLESNGSGLLPDDQVIDEDIILPQGYRDAWSFRLGGQSELSELLTLRAGAYYETSAIPTSSLSVALVDAPKWGLSTGLSVNVKDRLSIDAGFIQTFLQTQEIRDSNVRRLEVPVDGAAAQQGMDLEMQQGQAVGNGTMASSVTTGSLGLVYRFGKREGG